MPINDPERQVTARRLIAELNTATEKIDQLTSDLSKAHRRTNWNRAIAGVGLLVAVIGGVIAINGDKKLEAFQNARDEARRVACVHYNNDVYRQREGDLNGVLVTFGFAEAGLTREARAALLPTLPEEVQSRYKEKEEQTIVDNPYRDCTKEGIEEFYRNSPPDPATSRN